jgi:hypothetical protein
MLSLKRKTAGDDVAVLFTLDAPPALLGSGAATVRLMANKKNKRQRAVRVSVGAGKSKQVSVRATRAFLLPVTRAYAHHTPVARTQRRQCTYRNRKQR